MDGISQQLGFALSVTGPIFIMLLIGGVLKQTKIINDAFTKSSSKMIFTLALPALLFLKTSQANVHDISHIRLLIFALLSNLALYLLLEFSARWMTRAPQDRGVVIQGGFRANTAIIGLAYIDNAFDQSVLATAALYVAALTILYNILAVITLNKHSQNQVKVDYRALGKSLLLNPLIISIVLGLMVSYSEITMPTVINSSLQYFANMTLPLALICAGASINFKHYQLDRRYTQIATLTRLVIAPLAITLAAIFLGFRNEELGIIFLMSAAPAAATSFIMAQAMGANHNLAANIVLTTTLGSILTCSVGLTVLHSMLVH